MKNYYIVSFEFTPKDGAEKLFWAHLFNKSDLKKEIQLFRAGRYSIILSGAKNLIANLKKFHVSKIPEIFNETHLEKIKAKYE